MYGDVKRVDETKKSNKRTNERTNTVTTRARDLSHIERAYHRLSRDKNFFP